MVCLNCRERKHELCRGKTWCDCQHRGPTFVGTKAAGARIDELTALIEEPKVTSYEVKSAEELTALLQEMEAGDAVQEGQQ